MSATSEEWLEDQAERILARQRSRADTAKLVATFAAGVGGGLVASALAAGTPSGVDWVASWALGATVLLTAAVVLLDRLEEPDHSRVLDASALGHWNDSRCLFELRLAALSATYQNEKTVVRIRRALWLQLAAAVIAGVAAAYSMLRP